jgi:hypothetical protein
MAMDGRSHAWNGTITDYSQNRLFCDKKYENSHPNGTQLKETGIVCKFQLEFAKYLQLAKTNAKNNNA